MLLYVVQLDRGKREFFLLTLNTSCLMELAIIKLLEIDNGNTSKIVYIAPTKVIQQNT